MVVVDSVAGLALGLVVCRSRRGGLGLRCRDRPGVVAWACAAEISLGGGFALSLVVCRGSPTRGLVHGLIYSGFCLLWVDLRWWW